MEVARVTIREIRGLPDYSRILNLINAEWPPEFGDKSEDEKIRAMIDSHNESTDTVKFLFDGDRIVGFYRYSLWPRDEAEPSQAHIYDIAVLPEFQRRGLGSMLMNDLISDCRQKGLTRILSRSFRTNHASTQLHKALGFVVGFETENSLVWSIDILPGDPNGQGRQSNR
jgi:ribosomal protein S18 acetylase RimI-like enzyme